MNKELAFRVWDNANEKWVKGEILKFIGNLDGKYSFYPAADVCCGTSDKPKDYTIQQYTGIKDLKGQEIYEGDIVDAFYSDGHERDSGYDLYGKFEVKFMYGGWELFNGEDYHSLYMSEHYLKKMETFEVVGNIMENAELLK